MVMKWFRIKRNHLLDGFYLRINVERFPDHPMYKKWQIYCLHSIVQNLPTVGQKWVYNFIKRHDEIKARFSRLYNHQRAKCDDPKIIQKWFNRVQITIAQHGISLKDIHNFHETGLAMGLVATAKVELRCLVGPFLSSQGTANSLYL